MTYFDIAGPKQLTDGELGVIAKALYSNQRNLDEVFTAFLIMAFFIFVGFRIPALLVWWFFPSEWYAWVEEVWTLMFNVCDEVEWWEFVALTYTFVYSGYVYYNLVVHIDKYDTAVTAKDILKRIVPYLAGIIASMFIAMFLLWLYVWTGRQHAWDYLFYLALVLIAAIFYSKLDLYLARIDKTVEGTQQSALARTLADVPMVISLSILLIFAVVKQFLGGGLTDQYRHFIGGALAFQMWVSNVVFMLIGGNVFWMFFFLACGTCDLRLSDKPQVNVGEGKGS